MDELKNYAAWMGASERRREEIVQTVLARLPRFEFAYARNYGPTEDPFYIASLRDTGTGVVFNLIPGGAFQMGLSEGERETLRSWVDEGELNEDEAEIVRAISGDPPARAVRVDPFLMARFPILLSQYESIFGEPTDERLNGMGWDVAVIGLERISRLEDQMRTRWGYRLPTEAEWEFACRAGSIGLWHGPEDEWPSEQYWAEEHTDSLCESPTVNRFGLASMGGYAEICADLDEQRNRQHNRVVEPIHIMRGGAKLPFPWQDCGEWMMLLSAARQNTSGSLGAYSVRPVIPLQ